MSKPITGEREEEKGGAAPPSADSSQIHKYKSILLSNFKVAAHIYLSKHTLVSERCVLVTEKKKLCFVEPEAERVSTEEHTSRRRKPANRGL